MAGIHGYILTREHLDKGRHHSLRYTGVCDRGPFEVLITRDRPVFFIERPAVLPENCRFHERRQIELTTFHGRPVDALYFTSTPGLYTARKVLADAGIPTYESDILPEDRYLMERFIHGSVEITGQSFTRGGLLRFTDPGLSPAAYHPRFSVMSLDIETGQRGELYSIACHMTGRHTGNSNPLPPGLVLMSDRKTAKANPPQAHTAPQLPPELRGAPPEPLSDTGWMVRLPGEKELLTAFLHLMNILDPDILIGWHVVGFDLVFLDRKCRQHGIPFTLGRNRQRAELREIRKGVYGIDISGRIVIDGPPTLRGAFYSFDNFRLETVAASVLGEGKDIGEDQDKVAEIERRFREDKTALARYNLLDCTLVADIFRETGLIDLTWKRAQLSGLPMDRVGRSVAAFDHFMLPRIHRHGLVAP
ncbi:MAG: hypothetical protein MI802_19435, partial [Desulfobacterales bacterium]|nr:hypothetical protein [Desulfobacterales bacterium]